MIREHKKYVEAVKADLLRKKKHNKLSIEKLAAGFGIRNKNLVKELTELSIVNIAREYAHNPKLSVKQRYNSIVSLYKSQVNLSHRTSESIRLQQYSTPAPIGYLAGVFCAMDKKPNKFYFEPSAGNGLLTIASKPEWFVVNEIDDIRNANLKTSPYRNVMKQDASKAFVGFAFQVDAVITNPPFGVLLDRERVGNFTTKTLDHLMAAIALQTMKHDGKAAIIIGGHTNWDDHGRIQRGKNRDFFLWLYHNYHVMDVINIDGHKLYSRQGTAFDVRLILIDSRKIKPDGYPPLKKVTDVIVDSFDQLFDRVIQYVDHDVSSIVSKVIRAKELGKKAFAHGKLRIAGNDADLLKLFKANQVGDPETIKIMTAWYVGWDNENLSLNSKNSDSLKKKSRIRIARAKAMAKLKTL